ncbi:ornithine aminotransferase [Marinicauda salina]|uniref:Ornithine aminotransferase n=1 Tax=Marinicauda salina TaxID=2135793 RepID=A0A2U2BX21_9PROT|nr:BON domain-containing protein [Marinicauda salina]PWE18514.1 ornithine aminotransferase [Marinicauda salina]
MKDVELRELVEAELEWEPSLNAAHVAVTVHDSVVTLGGHVETYAEKLAAERAVRRVKQVRGVAMDIEVRPPSAKQVDDEDIATRAVNSLRWQSNIPGSDIHVSVNRGWITLGGDVEWRYQREAAERAVRYLSGVVGVTNEIAIRSTSQPDDLKQRIVSALARNAAAEAKSVAVDVEGGQVRLSGKVHSWHDRKLIEDAIWAAPGVTSVKDEIRIG